MTFYHDEISFGPHNGIVHFDRILILWIAPEPQCKTKFWRVFIHTGTFIFLEAYTSSMSGLIYTCWKTLVGLSYRTSCVLYDKNTEPKDCLGSATGTIQKFNYINSTAVSPKTRKKAMSLFDLVGVTSTASSVSVLVVFMYAHTHSKTCIYMNTWPLEPKIMKIGPPHHR